MADTEPTNLGVPKHLATRQTVYRGGGDAPRGHTVRFWYPKSVGTLTGYHVMCRHGRLICRPRSDVLGQPQCVVDCCVDIAARHCVADAEQFEGTARVPH